MTATKRCTAVITVGGAGLTSQTPIMGAMSLLIRRVSIATLMCRMIRLISLTRAVWREYPAFHWRARIRHTCGYALIRQSSGAALGLKVAQEGGLHNNSIRGFTVYNNVTKYTQRGLRAQAPGHDPIGLTHPRTPYTNYTASDREKYHAFDRGLEQLIGGYMATQIHELGNSIANIIPNHIGKWDAADPDSGYQLQLCVTEELLFVN